MNNTKNEFKKINAIFSKCVSASTLSLSKLMHEKVYHNDNQIKELRLGEIGNIADHNEVFAVYLKCEGLLRVGFLFYLPLSEATHLANHLLGKTSKKLTAMGKSAIMEVGNLMANSFLNESGLMIHASISGCTIDMLKIVLQEPVTHVADMSDKIIFSDIIFRTENNIKLHFAIIMDPVHTKNFLQVK